MALLDASSIFIIPGHEVRVRVEIGHGVLADVDGERPHDVGEAETMGIMGRVMTETSEVIYTIWGVPSFMIFCYFFLCEL